MRVLITLAERYFPQQGGGSQSSARELLSMFRRHELTAAVACQVQRKTKFGLGSSLRMMMSGRPCDDSMFEGQRVIRLPRPGQHIKHAIAAFNPDVVLVQAMAAMPVAHAVSQMGVPLVVYWRDVELSRMEGVPTGLNARYIANSAFTADFYRSRFGVDSVVIPPLILRERYVASHPTREAVVFIGTVPEKGLEVALQTAASCPGIPFLFVESWIVGPVERAATIARIQKLPNVTFVPHQSNMASVYARARFMLVPSRWEEAWGRVASEAGFNSIPSIGSNIGGLPEAIGPGGILVEPDAPAADWAAHVRRLWGDARLYKSLSIQAGEYAHREQLDPEWAFARILSTLQAAMADHAVGTSL